MASITRLTISMVNDTDDDEHQATMEVNTERDGDLLDACSTSDHTISSDADTLERTSP